MVGAEPRPVRIEAHVGRPIESFSLVGLPDTSVREAKQRVRAAILSTGQELPHRQITVNLSPADLPKAGSDYDLPIALGVLAASKVIPNPARMIVAGELALDGTVRRSRWAIGAASWRQNAGGLVWSPKPTPRPPLGCRGHGCLLLPAWQRRPQS